MAISSKATPAIPMVQQIGVLAIEAQRTADALRSARAAGVAPRGAGGVRDLTRQANEAAAALRAAIDLHEGAR